MIGRVDAVTSRGIGAEVVAASSAWWVLVEDASPFDADGGMALVNDTPRRYVSVNFDKEEIAFEDPLTVAVGDRVQPWPEITSVTAMVRIYDDGEAVQARVPHALRSQLPAGVRTSENSEAVELGMHGRELVVEDVLGRDGAQSFGDPIGTGTDISGGGVQVRDVLMADSLTSNGDITSVGVPLVGRLAGGPVQGWLDRFSAASVARQVFSGLASAKPTGQEWGYAVIGATCRAGRLYRVSASVSSRPVVTGASSVIRLRVGAGSPAGLSSPEVARVDIGPATGPLHTPSGYAQAFVGYVSDTDIELLVTYYGAGGATPEMHYAELCIEDAGPQGSYGGGEYRQVGPSDPDPTTPASREYVSTWQATDSRVYYENGLPIDGSQSWDHVEQGNDPSTPDGHRRSLVLFGGGALKGEVGKTVPQTLTGATVTKVEVWLTYQLWGDEMGGVALLQPGDFSSIPSTLPDPSGLVERPTAGRWKAGAGMWVVVPAEWFGAGQQGVVLGGGFSWAMKHFGKAFSPNWHDANARPHLRITYVR